MAKTIYGEIKEEAKERGEFREIISPYQLKEKKEEIEEIEEANKNQKEFMRKRYEKIMESLKFKETSISSIPELLNFLRERIENFKHNIDFDEYTNEEKEFLYCLLEFLPIEKFTSYMQLLNDMLDNIRENNYKPKYLKLSTSSTRKGSLLQYFKKFKDMNIIIDNTNKNYKKGAKGSYKINKLGLREIFDFLEIIEIKHILKGMLDKQKNDNIAYNYPIKKNKIKDSEPIIKELNEIRNRVGKRILKVDKIIKKQDEEEWKLYKEGKLDNDKWKELNEKYWNKLFPEKETKRERELEKQFLDALEF